MKEGRRKRNKKEACYYVVNAENSLIDSGFKKKEDAQAYAKKCKTEYPEIKASIKVYSKRYLKSKGVEIHPEDKENWENISYYMEMYHMHELDWEMSDALWENMKNFE